LPNMRGVVAHELRGQGESQSKIANMLGITQARVSNYLSKRKSVYESELSKRFGIQESEIEGFGKALSEDLRRSQVDGIFTLYSIWKNMLFNGDVCMIHQKESQVSRECSVCMDLHRQSGSLPSDTGATIDEESGILHNISGALSEVQNSPNFPLIMPEVSVNIAMCKTNPKSKRDVAAIPGRINKIHGRAKAFVVPEFGSSNHMSNVLILFHSKFEYVRSAINFRYDNLIDDALTSLGIKKVFTKPRLPRNLPRAETWSMESPDEIILERLTKLEIPRDVITNRFAFSIIDKGSEGLEPMTYLIGKNATEVTEASLRVADLYAGSMQKRVDR
jgi:predicted fused transcriptional regulator/phosphomethylpyrimidine kinase/predicted transcriptional regulator